MTNENIDKTEIPSDGSLYDETDISLRAHFARMDDERIQQYEPTWTDEEVIEWDGEFRADGVLMLVCCERDIEIDEYRRVLEEHLRQRLDSQS